MIFVKDQSIIYYYYSVREMDPTVRCRMMVSVPVHVRRIIYLPVYLQLITNLKASVIPPSSHKFLCAARTFI